MLSRFKHNLVLLSSDLLSSEFLLGLNPRAKVVLFFIHDFIIQILIKRIIKRHKSLFIRTSLFLDFKYFLKFRFILMPINL